MNILAKYAKTQTPIANTSINNHKKPNTTKTSIFYINDIHGQVPKMQRLLSASYHASLQAKHTGADMLKLCSGDTFIGSDENRNAVAASFLNLAGFDAQTLGNHEFDTTASGCAKLFNNLKTKILGTNLNFPNKNSALAKKVMKSTLIETASGEKYGIIGIQPTDMVSRIKKKEGLEGITVDDKSETIEEIRDEITKLQKQGTDKIILLSHAGNKFEKEIAQSVDGIDVILGGHSHELIEGVNKGKNLLYSPSGAPVIITQAGRDGNYFGILNLEFDTKGHIVKVQNSVTDTNFYSPNMVMQKETDKILGISPQIGVLKPGCKIPKDNLLEENPWADFVADAIRTNLDSDIVLINSANFRGSVDSGVVTERDITSIFPFNNKLYKVKLNEEDLVDAIKAGAKSLISENHKPGLLQVSGLSYAVNKDGEVTELFFVDKNGNKSSINVENPNPDKIYTAIYDEFSINGGDDMDMLEKDDEDIITRYEFDKDKVTIDYIKSLKQPFEVKEDGRIRTP